MCVVVSSGGVLALRVRVVWRTGVYCLTKGGGVCTVSACCMEDGKRVFAVILTGRVWRCLFAATD